MTSFRCFLALSSVAFTCMLSAQAPAARTEIANAAQPQLAVSSDGRVWLVYGQFGDTPATPAAHSGGHKHKGHQPPQRPGDVFVTHSTDGGATFAPAVKVAAVPKLMLGRRRGPRVAAHGDRITVTIVAHELLAFTSKDGGRTWGAPVTINDVPTSAREGLHDLSGAADGRAFVTWLDLRAGKMELYGAESRDGGLTWGANERLYTSPDKSICECCHPSALFDSAGNLAVMWRNSIAGNRDMWLMTRAAGAKTFSPATKLGEGAWEIKGCPIDGGDLIARGKGRFDSVWQRAGDIFFSAARGAEAKLGKGTQPVAVGVGTDALVVWQNGSDLWSVRSPGKSQPMKHAADARFPALVSLPKNAGAVLAYERGSAVVVERN